MKELKELLEQKPYSHPQQEKEKFFMPAIRAEARWHYGHSQEYKNLCDSSGFKTDTDFSLEELPYFPVTIFKKFDLLSVPRKQIIKTLYSSSTSGSPSKIMVDKETADSQTEALAKILVDFLGEERRHFVMFDTEETIKSREGELSSRGTAIRGMLSLAKNIHFLLNTDLKLDKKLLSDAVSKIKPGEPVCFFGFTWLLYNVWSENKNNKEVAEILKAFPGRNKITLHIGGWKKLKDLEVSKEEFNTNFSSFLGVNPRRIIDFYGMTEQLGSVYPDCGAGYKHAPLYSEIIIRNASTLKPAALGEVGLIELISPLPHSYPGIALISDDLGKVMGVDNCPCGRKGKYFIFEKRSETAEEKGCGDTLSL